MEIEEELEVKQILNLQEQIKEKLIQLGFVGDDDSMGSVIHHLAELSVWGKKLAHRTVPSFLSLPLEKKEDIGCVIVDLNYELTEMKEAIEDLEPALIKLMNFLTSK